MKTQEEIDQIRAEYKAQFDLDVRRVEAKLKLYESYYAAIREALANPEIHLENSPNELFPGYQMANQIAELKENLAYRKLQWELIQDEFDAADRVRGG